MANWELKLAWSSLQAGARHSGLIYSPRFDGQLITKCLDERFADVHAACKSSESHDPARVLCRRRGGDASGNVENYSRAGAKADHCSCRRVLDVRTGQLRANQAIVIEGEKIAQIVASSEVKAAAGDTTIDLPDATLLPGLIDAHTHLTFDLSSLGYQGLAISTAREALHGARNARLTLDAGFTTVRNLGAKDYADIALRDAINEGDAIGPRIIASGPALGITGGHCDENLLPPAFHHGGDGVADGVEAVQHKVREVIKYGADVIKICATGGVLSKGDDPNASQYTLEEMKAIVADAHRLGRRVAAHAHGAEGVRWASEAGVDSIEHGHLMDDASIATLKKNGTYLVPTLFLGEYMQANLERSDVPEFSKQKMRDVIAAMRKNTGKAFAAGVKVAFGTDAAVYPHGLNAGEFH